MIKIEKDFDAVPDILNSDNRKKAFKKNTKNKKFDYGKTLYKPDELKKQLHDIYHLKCVYCEDSLLNSPKHIEHYRPKDIYYWLAYSWDNLFLCCGSCNSAKGINFKTSNKKVKYKKESYEEIHSLGDKYDKAEKPKLINPEKDDIIKDILFDNNALISSNNDRVLYTIKTCNLNRNEVVQLRIEIINDFVSLIDDYYLSFNEDNLQDKSLLVKTFIPLVRKFINDCNTKKEFYSFRYFILNNIEIFFEDVTIQKIIKAIIKRNRDNLR